LSPGHEEHQSAGLAQRKENQRSRKIIADQRIDLEIQKDAIAARNL